MNSPARTEILTRIGAALRADAALPGVAAAGSPLPVARPAAPAQLLATFGERMSALGGESCLVADEDEAAAKIRERMAAGAFGSLAVQTSPLSLTIAARIEGARIARARDLTLDQLAATPCSLLEARALIADSGSAVVLLEDRLDRVLPYLPPVCFIVASSESLHPDLRAASLTDIAEAARSGIRGEGVIITGPSRTADIEKILILGAHGPKIVVVYVIAR